MTEATDGLPTGWAMTRIGEVCEVNPRKRKADMPAPEALVSFVQMSAVDADSGTITDTEDRPYSSVQKGYTVFQDDDVIFARITPCMENGKSAVARDLTNGLGFGSTEFHVLRASRAVLPEYVYHFVRQSGFRYDAAEQMTGAVGQARVPADFMRDVAVPLPPLDEQRRIVAAVEALLAQTAAVTERLGGVPKTMRRFRQSVLAAACDGRLTADWRAANPDAEPVAVGLFNPTLDEPVGWQRVGLGDLVSEIGQGWSPKCDVVPAADGEWGVIKTTAVQAGQFVGAENKRLPDDLDPRVHLEIKKGDLLITRAGPRSRAGVACLVKSTRAKLMVCDKVYRIHLDEARAHPGYVELLLNEPEMVQSIDAIKTGTSDSGMNLTQGRFLDLEVALPPLAEQAEIVRRAEALLVLADKVEARVTIAHRHAERTAQAVLAKAFRGELVPTEASLAASESRDFESGADLLARLQQAPAAAAKRRGRLPKAATLFE